MTDVTPEILRIILDHPDCPTSVRKPLAAWSLQLAPVEMWAQILHDAAAPIDGAWVSYEHAPEDMKARARRQAHAVIKAIPGQSKFDKGGEELGRPLRQWDHLHDIPKDVQKVRNGDGRECVREQLVWKVIHPDDGRPIIPRWHSRGPFTELPTIEEPNA
jgi:hypothetical protein